MNLKKFNKYLKKVNSLNSIITDNEDLSTIELDLIKEYVRKMYDSLIDDEEPIVKKAKKQKKIEIEEPIVAKKENYDKIVEEEKIPELKEEVIEEKIEKEEVIEEVMPSNTHTTVFSDELLEVFEEKESNELSEKLSLTPIKNLTKAFSINERIFTVREMFGGDNEAFDKAIKDLNKLDSVEEAKDYILDNLVEKYDWDNSEMIKKLKHLFKTVKRRYV